jgi:2-(1,2-epoxy-1,2-dihydrophenyl)acetyl-CoA isomerase
MSAERDFVGTIDKEGIAWGRFNRPDALNAFSDQMRDDMIAFLLRIENDPKVRCLVLQGTGKHFMAGGDVKSFVAQFDRTPEERRAHFEAACHKMNQIIYLLRRLPKPVVSSVSGACAGLGLSFVLASDFAIAADNSVFTLAYVKLGTTPDGGATYFLPRLVGMKHAMEIALLGDRFDAAKAEKYGLINSIVPADKLADETKSLAQRLAEGPTHAIGRTKALLNAAPTQDLEAALQAEGVSFGICSATPEMAEGVAAFVAKRPAAFNKT